MLDEIKVEALLKLFNSFPSMATLGEAQAKAMLGSYLEALSSYSSEIVSSACKVAVQRGAQFAPTAGELFVECKKLNEAKRRHDDWLAIGGRKLQSPALPPPAKPIAVTYEQLADWKEPINGFGPYVMRVGPDGNPLRIPEGYPGAGQVVQYGYLTPKEAEAVKSARSRRGSAPAPTERREEAPRRNLAAEEAAF